MKSSNILIDRYRDNESIDILDRKKDVYKLLEYMDQLIIQPKDNQYDYAFFFFVGFNENAGKYVNLFKPFFENFTKVSKIKFKIILPMPKKISRDIFITSSFVDYNDSRYEYVFAWNILLKDENDKRYGFISFQEIDDFNKKLIEKEKKILGSQDRLIFCGFSQGGRYMVNLLENLNLKPKFNVIFKSPITIYNIKNDNNKVGDRIVLKNWKYKSLDKEILKKGDFLKNKFYLLYSINDKLFTLPQGLLTYEMIKEEFTQVKIRFDNGKKHIVDYNSLEYLKEILLKEIVNDKAKF